MNTEIEIENLTPEQAADLITHFRAPRNTAEREGALDLFEDAQTEITSLMLRRAREDKDPAVRREANRILEKWGIL